MNCLKQCRPAYTLVEMLVAVTLTGLLLSATAMVLGGTFRIDSQLRDQRELSATLSRLSLQLRADAHRATTAELAAIEENADNQNACLLTSGEGETIRYTPTKEGITREVTRDEQTVHRDLFRLHRQVAATFVLDEFQGHPRLTLRLEPKDSSPEPAAGLSAGEIQAIVRLHAAPAPAQEEMP